MSYRTLKATLDSRGVLSISLNRPEIRNAFNGDLIEDLIQVFGIEAPQTQVRVVVLSGAGSVFCAGGDLKWMKASAHLSHSENLRDTRKLARMFAVVNECSKPVIGAVHGAAIGGGVGLVSVCDIVVAEENTQFSLSEVKLGIIPACIGPFVISKIGASHARALFMSASRFTGARAKEIGLVHELVQGPEAMATRIQELIDQLLQCGPQAMTVAKRMILDLTWAEKRTQLPDSLEYVARILADLRTSPEGQEGLRAFLEKRKPDWIAPSP
jgi:methylglutaconyl-CoA hydratase